MMTDKIKWGIIGCGDVTEVKSGPAFNLVEGSELVAVMRRDGAKAADYAKRHKVPNSYDNADDLINNPAVNAVYIATPPNAHAELSIKALKAGKPVYVEKPMALNFEECQQMIQASKEYNTPLSVAYYRRALPSFLKVKDLVDAGAIGGVKFVNIQFYKSLSEDEKKGNAPWRVDPKIAGGGHFIDMASHQLDFIDFVFGAIKKVKSIALNQTQTYTAEDMVSASFLLDNSIVLNGSWCFSVPSFLEKDSIELVGDKGKISLSCFDFSPIELITETGKETFNYEKPKHVQQGMIGLVVEELRAMGKSPSDGVSGSRTTWVMEQVLKEYYNTLGQ